MDETTAQQLIDLNRQFYQTFASAFAATRRRIQPGVRKLLARLPEGNWLDLGCGSGALAEAWLQSGRSGGYYGLDFSSGLLDEARQNVPAAQVQFQQADLSNSAWPEGLTERCFAGVLCFAVLHHLPGAERRTALLQQVANLLPPGGWFVHSVWQFDLSPRLQQRILPWETIGITPEQLEPGDTLLDWRHTLPEQAGQIGLRYVHRFELEELSALAESSGFAIQETFESDGDGGRLGLYQVWHRQPLNRAAKDA